MNNEDTISRAAAIAIIRERGIYGAGYSDLEREDDVVDMLEELPSVPPQVVHGRWEHLGGDEWCCTHCGEVITTEGSWDTPTENFCPNCEAKMGGEDDAVQ